jgi:hypothetical protein
MKLWRVIMSVNLKRRHDDGDGSPLVYDYDVQVPTFYVQAPTASEAQSLAIRVSAGSADPAAEYRSSGTIVRCYHDSPDPDESTAHSWNDRERA